MKKTYRFIATALLLGGCFAAQAQNIDFGRITDGEKAFRHYWQLNEEEAQRYRLYMEVAGKYRHKDVNPLQVLSMLAESREDKAYYAKKAAEYEHNIVMREIETAWLVSEAMSEAYLADAMQTFTDKLIGVDTLGYRPEKTVLEWQNRDEMVLLLGSQCLEAGCVRRFARVDESVPANTPRRVVIRGGQPLSSEAEALVKGWAHTTLNRFDPIEHHYLASIADNQWPHVRDTQVLRVLGVSVADKGQEDAAVAKDSVPEKIQKIDGGK